MRSTLFSTSAFLLFTLIPTGVFSQTPFSFDFLKQRAGNLAKRPCQPTPPVAPVLAGLNYDQYRAIRPAEAGGLWKDEQLPFRVEFHHAGYLFTKPVRFYLIDEKNIARPLEFDPAFFDYSNLVLEDEFDPAKSGAYAGFRILHPLHADEGGGYDEIGSFLGASYFRLVGRGQRYGISARGLALNVVHPTEREEFPDFVEFWIKKPQASPGFLEVYALLDSPSVTGAYHFKIRPGSSTSAETRVQLNFRKKVDSVGLAPLTSMFWFGENSTENSFPDWRPEVHDSDGLLFRTWNDEVVWRPLYNHRLIRYSFFNTPDPKGFGLMQRDRDFQNYQDLTATYHRVPSAWIEPKGKWGEGSVALVELPTDVEAHDNIVSFFQPGTSPSPGEPYDYAYTVSKKLEDEAELSADRVTATRIGQIREYPDTRRFVVDFCGPGISSIPADGPVFAEITSSANGYITENQCYKNVVTDGWRIEFKLDTDSGNRDPVELRCFLKNSTTNQILSETWSYQWSPSI
ncbi:MAG: glucan biosynthesis protein G [Verrucomicrobiales bacterium]|nr:glucan biosynthesis protein G [Verrucomicrobiales bacterium]